MKKKARERGRHVFIIGKRFDAKKQWPGVPGVKNFFNIEEDHSKNLPRGAKVVTSNGPETVDEPGIICRICNVALEFAVRPPI